MVLSHIAAQPSLRKMIFDAVDAEPTSVFDLDSHVCVHGRLLCQNNSHRFSRELAESAATAGCGTGDWGSGSKRQGSELEYIGLIHCRHDVETCLRYMRRYRHGAMMLVTTGLCCIRSNIEAAGCGGISPCGLPALRLTSSLIWTVVTSYAYMYGMRIHVDVCIYTYTHTYACHTHIWHVDI